MKVSFEWCQAPGLEEDSQLVFLRGFHDRAILFVPLLMDLGWRPLAKC